MTKKEIDAEIVKLEPGISRRSPEFWAYRTLFTLPLVGPFATEQDAVEKVRRFWRTGKDLVHLQNTMVRRACRNGVVRFGPKNREKFLAQDIYSGDVLGTTLGACILRGLVRRVKR